MDPSQKMPYIYVAEWNKQKIVIVDTLLQNEAKYAECFPILFLRALVVCGVKQFFMFAEATSTNPSMHVGNVFLFDNFMPLNVINPFIGRHHKE